MPWFAPAPSVIEGDGQLGSTITPGTSTASSDGIRILIVLLGALGDVVRGFAVLPSLKAEFPNVHITWLVEPKSAGIVRLHPLVDEVIEFRRPYSGSWFGRLSQSLREVLLLRANLAARQFDVVLDMQRHFKSGVFSRLARARRRIGFARGDAKEGNWLLNTEHIARCDPSRSKVWHYLQFLEPLGLSVPTDVTFGLADAVGATDVPSEVLAAKEQGARLVGVVMGSTWDSKNWTKVGYVRLCKQLLADTSVPYVVVLLGDKSQAKLAEEVKNLACGSNNSGLSAIDATHNFADRIINVAGSTTLKQLLAILKVCDVAVGPDSGPGHIAAALATPYVGLFGPTTEGRVAPFGQEERVLRVPLGCAPCMQRTCPGLGNICMSLISAEMVRSAVDKANTIGH